MTTYYKTIISNSCLMSILLFLGHNRLLLAAADTLPRDKFQYINEVRYVASERIVDHIEPTLYVGQWLEYGYHDDLTLGSSAKIESLKINHHTIKKNSRSTKIELSRQYHYHSWVQELFIRKRLYQNKGLVLSVQPLISLPILYKSNYSKLPHRSAELRGLASYSWDKYYLNTELGIRMLHDHKPVMVAELCLIQKLNEKFELYTQLFGDFSKTYSKLSAQEALSVNLKKGISMQLGINRSVYPVEHNRSTIFAKMVIEF